MRAGVGADFNDELFPSLHVQDMEMSTQCSSQLAVTASARSVGSFAVVTCQTLCSSMYDFPELLAIFHCRPQPLELPTRVLAS